MVVVVVVVVVVVRAVPGVLVQSSQAS